MRRFKLYKQTKLKLLAAAVILIPLLSHCLFKEKPAAAPQPKVNVVVVKEISAPELDSFLTLWPAYVREGIADLGYSQISLSMETSVKNMNKKAAAWFAEKNWDIDRFYYIEQRLRTILKTIEVDKQISDNIEGLKTQLQISGGEQLSGMIEGLIAEQQQRLNIEKISRPELEMVKRRQQEILRILNAEPVSVKAR